MRVIGLAKLTEYTAKNPNAEQPLRAWLEAVKGQEWTTPLVIPYKGVSALRGGRAVFRISRNRYRVVAEIDYSRGIVFIRFVGSHAEYDRIDAETI